MAKYVLNKSFQIYKASPQAKLKREREIHKNIKHISEDISSYIQILLNINVFKYFAWYWIPYCFRV